MNVKKCGFSRIIKKYYEPQKPYEHYDTGLKVKKIRIDKFYWVVNTIKSSEYRNKKLINKGFMINKNATTMMNTMMMSMPNRGSHSVLLRM